MQVRDVMTENVQVVTPETTLTEAARLMDALGSGMVPVCQDRIVVGVLTDRDIAVRAIAEGEDPNLTCAGDVMTPDPIFCADEEDVEEAARMMGERQVRRLPVLDRRLRLVGIVSLGDIIARTSDRELAGRVLGQVSDPTTDVSSNEPGHLTTV